MAKSNSLINGMLERITRADAPPPPDAAKLIEPPPRQPAPTPPAAPAVRNRAARDRAARKSKLKANDRRRAAAPRVQLACMISQEARDALDDWCERNDSTVAAAVEFALLHLISPRSEAPDADA